MCSFPTLVLVMPDNKALDSGVARCCAVRASFASATMIRYSTRNPFIGHSGQLERYRTYLNSFLVSSS
jgi:hypothetical protein